MKTALICSLLLLSGCASNEVVTKAQRAKGTVKQEPHVGFVCMFEGKPQNLIYKELGKVLAVKETYGELDEVFLPLAKQARRLGANAVMNVENYQRFRGFRPDKAVTPFARGVAIQIQEPFVCPGKEY